jgi:predicted DNA-binding transcriptional regulator AlpA
MVQSRAVIPPWERLGLSRTESATMIGVSPNHFDELVDEGLMPSPKILKGRLVWSRAELSEAFERLPNRGTDFRLRPSKPNQDKRGPAPWDS